MNDQLDQKIVNILIGTLTPGFNRALGALEKAGAINLKKLRTEYRGVGSLYYDLVTEQFEYTASFHKESVRQLIEEEVKRAKKSIS